MHRRHGRHVALNPRASRNDAELAIAFAKTGTVFQQKVSQGNFVELPPKGWRCL
jgi:hypothetical protein